LGAKLNIDDTQPGLPESEATWIGAAARAPQRLVLTWGAREKEVTAGKPLLSIGRGELSGLVLKVDKVSRLHAVIKYTDLGFVLTDQSRNGTYVVDEDGKTHAVHNDTYLLTGAGSISFGIVPERGQPPFVRYAVRSL
jgi:pSer/pThr/pTyr-binding forkhead associated (FHA) protein